MKLSNDDADDEEKGCEELEGAGSGLVKQPLVSAPPSHNTTTQTVVNKNISTFRNADFRQIRQFYLLIRISKCPI